MTVTIVFTSRKLTNTQITTQGTVALPDYTKAKNYLRSRGLGCERYLPDASYFYHSLEDMAADPTGERAVAYIPATMGKTP